jgi:ParB family chromosome partitioning protein
MKRRKPTFAIDVADEDLQSKDEETSSAPSRRGPMAAAIVDNADSLKRREQLERDIRAENDQLAHEHVRLKKLGLILELVPLDSIETTKLVRDRSLKLDLELDDLVTSIQEIGLSNPIRVESVSSERYELIQGYRRLEAYRRLLRETKDERYATIPAAIVPSGDELETSYRRMVDENLVRKDISFAEMAELARAYSQDPQTPHIEPDKAVTALFKAAPYQKRSYIRAFAELLELVGEHLRFPHAIPRNLGLNVRRSVSANGDDATAIIAALTASPDRSVEEELQILRQHASQQPQSDRRAKSTKQLPRKSATKPGVTFEFSLPRQRAKCTVTAGRIEVKTDDDFSETDPQKFEEALAAFFDVLNGSRP